MTATLDRLSDGRLLINVVTGGDPVENKGDGIFLSHAERYEVTREFLHAYKALLAGETVNVAGKHIRHRGRAAAVSAGAGAAPAALFRRLVGGGDRRRGRDGRQVPDLGRAAGAGRREDRQGARPRRGSAAASSASASACTSSCARPREEAWAAADRLIAPSRRRDDRQGAGDLRAHGLGRAEPHERAARRPPRQAGGQPQPLGRRRPGARRRRHRAGRLARGSRGADGGVPGDRHRHLHPVRLPASRGGLPLRRAGLPAAAAGACAGARRRSRSTPGRSARPSPTRSGRRRGRPPDHGRAGTAPNGGRGGRSSGWLPWALPIALVVVVGDRVAAAA